MNFKRPPAGDLRKCLWCPFECCPQYNQRYGWYSLSSDFLKRNGSMFLTKILWQFFAVFSTSECSMFLAEITCVTFTVSFFEIFAYKTFTKTKWYPLLRSAKFMCNCRQFEIFKTTIGFKFTDKLFLLLFNTLSNTVQDLCFISSISFDQVSFPVVGCFCQPGNISFLFNHVSRPL